VPAGSKEDPAGSTSSGAGSLPSLFQIEQLADGGSGIVVSMVGVLDDRNKTEARHTPAPRRDRPAVGRRCRGDRVGGAGGILAERREGPVRRPVGQPDRHRGRPHPAGNERAGRDQRRDRSRIRRRRRGHAVGAPAPHRSARCPREPSAGVDRRTQCRQAGAALEAQVSWCRSAVSLEGTQDQGRACGSRRVTCVYAARQG